MQNRRGTEAGCRMAQTVGILSCIGYTRNKTALDNLEPSGKLSWCWTLGNLPVVGVCLGPDTLGSCQVRDVQACPPLAQPHTGLRKQDGGALIPLFTYCFLQLPQQEAESPGGSN